MHIKIKLLEVTDLKWLSFYKKRAKINQSVLSLIIFESSFVYLDQI